MDLDSLAEVDITALVIALIVGVMIFTSFGMEGLGWETMDTWIKVSMLVGGVLISYFVATMVINN